MLKNNILLYYIMGLFGRKKVVDLTEEYQPRRMPKSVSTESVKPAVSPSQSELNSSGNFFNFFGGNNSEQPVSSAESGNTEMDSEEKRRRLAKRLKDMTDKLEELSNQTYLLQQRIEVLEKKTNINKYE